MTRGVVVCLMLVACTPPAVAPKPVTAAEILRDTADTYAHAKTYVDRGTQSIVGSTDVTVRMSQTFETAFVRGGAFRWAFTDGREASRVIWSDGSQTLAAGDPEDGVDQEPNLAHAIAGLPGVPADVVHSIPTLLMPSLQAWTVIALHDGKRGRDEMVDGHPCWQVTGSSAGRTITLWIDMQTHLIRQIEQQYRIGRQLHQAIDTITRYEPQIDVQIDRGRLQPPPTNPARSQEPAWLGVMFEGHNGTSRVQSVVADGPAAHAGLQAGDVITKIDTQPVTKAADVVLRVRGEKPGVKLHVTVSRGGKELPIDVTLEKRPDLDDLQARLVDHPAPDFALATLSGPTSAKLADLRGHVVIVDFWATWCGPCAMAMPHLVDLAHKYKDLRVVGISDEDETDIKRYVAEHKIDYTIARDGDDVVTGRYLVTGLPTLVIIDKAGVVRALHVGAGDFDAIEAEVQQYSK